MSSHPHATVVIDPEGRDIPAEAARMRKAGPVARVELPGGVLAWAITSHDLLRELLTDPRVSRDPNKHWPAWQNGEITSEWPLYSFIKLEGMANAYGEEHTRLRTLISKAFTARRVAALRPNIEKITNELLDQLTDTPTGEPVDLSKRFAFPLPIRVISDLFGVPDHQHDTLRELYNTALSTAATAEEIETSYREIYAFLNEVIAARRVNPGDDLTSGLISARDNDDQLTESELIDTLLIMLGAGFETTVYLIGNAVRALLTHPDQLELVRTGQATWEDVVEETLRWAPSGAHIPLRYAVDDITTDTVTIKKGEAILASFIAASHDPAKHGPDADKFNITRPSRRDHISFGHGVHFCMGAPLARLEALIALPALFDRFPDLALAAAPEQLQPLPSFMLHGMRELPVTLHRPY